MKRNIIIAGVPRAGKSTISNAISRKFGYVHISMDSILAGFERNFPELGINTYADMSSMDILKNISGKIAPFINTMMLSGEYDEFGRGMVVDIYQLLPEDYAKHIDPALARVYYMVTADVSAEQRYDLLKAHDTPRDYTYARPEAELREGCGYIVEQSRLMREQCLRHNLPYLETSRDRAALFARFLAEEPL